MQNVGTAYAIYEAVQKNKPLFERVVTVTGKALTSPSNFLVRIGTPIRCLIDAAGGMPENTGKIISGGPMMGKALASVDAPVCKGSSGVLLLTREESVRKPARDCIRCAKCVNVCPAKALEMKGGRIHISRRKCIRCYCCHEMCPFDAIKIR